jgi:hypothetical protein
MMVAVGAEGGSSIALRRHGQEGRTMCFVPVSVVV